MHVILNVESLLKPSGGIGCYTRHLLEGILKSNDINKVTCFSGYHWADGQAFLAHINASSQSFSLHSSFLTRIKDRLRSFPFVYRLYATYRSVLFNYRAKNNVDAIYHEPNFILKPFKGLSIASIHDLSHIHCPQYHPRKRVEFLASNLSKTLSDATHILTDSEFVKNELIQIMGVDEQRITAIPLGVNKIFHPRTGSDLQSVLSDYGLLEGHYLLSLSTLEPRKNILQILDAYIQLDESIKKKYPLILVGSDGWHSHDIKSKIKALEVSEQVKHIGYVTAKDLPFIVAGARGFIFIPFYEGFGLPPLEAMASGVPILTSDVSSLPEVVGDVGLMTEPDDEKLIIHHLKTLLTDDAWRNKAIDMGIERAGQFTWERCVKQTIKVYKQCQLS